MTVLDQGSGFLALWFPVNGADRFVLERFGAPALSLPVTTTVYSWHPDLLAQLDLTKAVVSPQFLVVKAYAGEHLLEVFLGGRACPVGVFIAARGSGQNGLFGAAFGKGLGDRGLRVWDGIRSARGLSEGTFPAVAVDYPAIPVGTTDGGAGNLPALYSASVSTGMLGTKIAVLQVLTTCPRTRVVLFGYSQGAQVVGDAFAELSPDVRSYVAAVVLFADPRYRSGDPRVDYQPAEVPGSGIKGRRPLLPQGDKALVQSWCWAKDAICQRPPRGLHFHGPEYDGYEGRAAQDVAARLL